MRKFSKEFWWGTIDIRLSKGNTDQWSDEAVSMVLSSFGNKMGVVLALPSKFSQIMKAEHDFLEKVIKPIVQGDH